MIVRKGSAPAHQASLVILQGDDHLAIEEEIKSISQGSDQDVFSAMNSIHLDGSILSLKELSMELRVLPLGGLKRTVIVENAHELISKKGAQDWINEEMTDIIPATMLILVVDDELKYKEGGMAWARIGAKHWMQDLFSRFQGKTRWIELPLPSDKEMPAWIQREAERQGGAFNNHAAAVLARFVGRDLFQARQEISKAISYVGDGGQVSAKEVHLLNASSREESIFSLVDAIGQRDRRQAMKYYYHISHDIPHQQIFSMLVRQVRFLILTKEALNNKKGERGVMDYCNLRHAFIAKKLITQSRKFTDFELQDLYRSLDRIDENTKLGRESLDVALEGLIAHICK